jgi:hypothetical protein
VLVFFHIRSRHAFLKKPAHAVFSIQAPRVAVMLVLRCARQGFRTTLRGDKRFSTAAVTTNRSITEKYVRTRLHKNARVAWALA